MNQPSFTAISRWGYVLRHHRKAQLMRRLERVGKGWWLAVTGGKRYLRIPKTALTVNQYEEFHEVAERKLNDRGQTLSPGDVAGLLDGRFCFLNEQRYLPDPIDWRLLQSPQTAHLWRFYLHYHEFLLDLLAGHAAEGITEQAAVNRAWQLVDQWIDGNSLSDRRVLLDGWHPYCISRRIAAWLFLWALALPTADQRRRVLASLQSQALFLEDHLELDVRGNHLFENAKALVMVGTFLQGPQAQRWLRKGIKILRDEFTEQILAHGEHFERSPMYHCQVLDGLLDLAGWTRTAVPEFAQECRKIAGRMARFLLRILHPDGQIPLLADSCFGETPEPTALIKAALGQEHCAYKTAETVGEYWAYRSERDFLLLDAGPVGVDYLPAHAHSDLLTFEGSIGGRRVFVDSGVCGYASGPMREYCRSTIAHNVLQIDDQPLCDTYSQFRMGHRGWPTSLSAGELHGFYWASAFHNAYRRMGIASVGRWMACRPGGPWICVDWSGGDETRRLTSWLHLHPDVHVEVFGSREAVLTLGEEQFRLRYLSGGDLDVVKSWYCSGFGRREENRALRWQARRQLPGITGWCLTWPGQNGHAELEPNELEHQLVWREGEQHWQFRLAGFQKQFAPQLTILRLHE